MLKTGLLALQAKFSELHKMENLGEVSSRLLGASLLRRLLLHRVELKSCMEGDCCAAQSDLRHLRTEQLLVIRVDALELLTASATHSARRNFLQIAEKHLFQKFARESLSSAAGWLLNQEVEDDLLFVIGVQLCLVLGAVHELLEAQSENRGEMPTLWAFAWPGMG